MKLLQYTLLTTLGVLFSFVLVADAASSDGHWLFFNDSVLRPATATNQVLIGAENPSTSDIFEVVGSGSLSDGLTSGGSVLATSLDSSHPAFSFTNDPDTGMYAPGAGNIFFVSNGAVGPRIRNQQLLTTITGRGNRPNITSDSDTDTGIVWNQLDRDRLFFSTGGVLSLSVDRNSADIFGVLNVQGVNATSTFANGINLSGGCFSVNGVCVGGGEETIASNMGGFVEVFKQKSGSDLKFRTLKAGKNITVAQNENDIEISTETTPHLTYVPLSTTPTSGAFASYTRVGAIAFGGSSDFSAPQYRSVVNLTEVSSGGISVRLRDVTNNITIWEKNGITNAGLIEVGDSYHNSIPSDNAVFELQVKKDGAGGLWTVSGATLIITSS